MNTNCTDSLNTISSGFLDIVSANVARIRNEKGISQLKLSNEIGLSGSAYYGRMEIRARNNHFSLTHLIKIATVLEVDICEFFKPIEWISF